jgi:hypothetical protein
MLFFILLAYLYDDEITLSVSFDWFYFFFSIFFFSVAKILICIEGRGRMGGISGTFYKMQENTVSGVLC